jgi:hypothetical protein
MRYQIHFRATDDERGMFTVTQRVEAPDMIQAITKVLDTFGVRHMDVGLIKCEPFDPERVGAPPGS